MGRKKQKPASKNYAEFQHETFKTRVLFAWGCDGKYLEKICKKYDISIDWHGQDLGERDDGGLFTDKKCPIPFLVWVKKSDDYYTLLHECVHLAYHMMEDKNVPIIGNDEVLAYLVEYWTRKFWKEVSRHE